MNVSAEFAELNEAWNTCELKIRQDQVQIRRSLIRQEIDGVDSELETA